MTEAPTTVRSLLEQIDAAINDADEDFTSTFPFRCAGEGTCRLVIVDCECDLQEGEGEADSTVVAANAFK